MAGGPALPDSIVEILDGTSLAAKEGETFLLMTAAETGWPHLALLSVGEIVATSARELRLALWPGTGTTANLTRTGKATLAFVHDGAAYTIRLATRGLGDVAVGKQTLVCFAAQVVDVVAHVADYADLTGGITFRLKRPDAIVPRWERTIAGLRGLDDPAKAAGQA
ncbi:MAG: pyridoxamine 5'-phosphate oxidase family protein [Chloroflexi bacterium]|nr:pyridoxamine 5'-phosphate oxidase family protein [Chloroflexota bacterium]